MKTPTFQEYLSESPAKSDVQHRGICQICGREQAVRANGNITHHGYTIENGWFEGTCPGQQHKPLQFDKSETERQIAIITKSLPEIQKNIDKLTDGSLHPLKVKTDRLERVGLKFKAVMIDWKDANEYQRKGAVASAINFEKNRLQSGKTTISYLHNLITQFYGKDLKHVARMGPGAKPQIEVGSKIKVFGKEEIVTRIADATARGVGPAMNGQYVPHVFWIDQKTGREYSYPKRLARLAK